MSRPDGADARPRPPNVKTPSAQEDAEVVPRTGRSANLFCSRETNLKVKQAPTVTGEMGDAIDVLAKFNGERPPLATPHFNSGGADVGGDLLWQVRSSVSPPTTTWTSSEGTC